MAEAFVFGSTLLMELISNQLRGNLPAQVARPASQMRLDPDLKRSDKNLCALFSGERSRVPTPG